MDFQIQFMAQKVIHDLDSVYIVRLLISYLSGSISSMGEGKYDHWRIMRSIALRCMILHVITKLLPWQRPEICLIHSRICISSCGMNLCNRTKRMSYYERKVTHWPEHKHMGPPKMALKLDHPAPYLALFWGTRTSKSLSLHPGFLACVLSCPISPLTSCMWPLTVNNPGQSSSLLETSCSSLEINAHSQLQALIFILNKFLTGLSSLLQVTLSPVFPERLQFKKHMQRPLTPFSSQSSWFPRFSYWERCPASREIYKTTHLGLRCDFTKEN